MWSTIPLTAVYIGALKVSSPRHSLEHSRKPASNSLAAANFIHSALQSNRVLRGCQFVLKVDENNGVISSTFAPEAKNASRIQGPFAKQFHEKSEQLKWTGAFYR